MRVVLIPGSLRRHSFNRRLLQAAETVVPPGSTAQTWDRLADLPHFDEDVEATGTPAAVAGMRAAIAGSDALLIATPEYNGSVPGPLKNAVDWASRPRGHAVLAGRPVAVIGASITPGGAARARADLEQILTRAGAQVLPTDLGIARASEAHFASTTRDPVLLDRLSLVVTQLSLACDSERAELAGESA